MKTFKNKVTIYINDKSKQIYNLQKNKSEFIDKLILDYSKNAKDDLTELKNLQQNIERIMSQLSELKAEIKDKSIDIINLMFLSQTEKEIIKKFKDYIANQDK